MQAYGVLIFTLGILLCQPILSLLFQSSPVYPVRFFDALVRVITSPRLLKLFGAQQVDEFSRGF